MSEGNISHAIVLSLYFFTLLVHVYKKNCTLSILYKFENAKTRTSDFGNLWLTSVQCRSFFHTDRTQLAIKSK